MRTSTNILVFAALLLSLASCKKVLEKRDLGSLQGDLVFSDSVLARTYVDYIYDQNLPSWGGNANLTDETFGESKYFEGTLTNRDVTDFGTALANNNNYAKIRTMNMFFDEIDKGTLTETWKNKLKGQVYFFRAYRYFELVKLYGGVPLVLTPQDAVGVEAKEAAYIPRNKTSETIAQIVKDLDMAIALLPGRWMDENNDWGRVTSGTAAAMKGRALQLWASPIFNPTGLTERWQAAYDAALQAKTILSENGYGLNTSFENMWFQEKGNPEAVFITGYNNSTADQARKNNGYDNATRPALYGTAGGSNQPTRELVDAFPMKDGKMVGSSTKYVYDPQLFYKNRDPRFDKTIGFNGATWPLNGIATNKVWTYYVGNKSEEAKPTSTGFYTRKAIDPAVAAGNVQYSGTDWMEIRYAEVLLNLAEAAAAINKPEEAYAELIAIRTRAGIEAGDDNMYGLQPNMTSEQLIQAILYERQIEFAFEGKRYWDLRRYKMFETLLNGKTRTGSVITFKPSADVPDAATFKAQRDGVIPLDKAYSENFTITSKILDTRYTVNWKPEYYFLPLPEQALINNPKLQQNNTWGGTFDPLL
ncbi:MAG: RagB/SusD family nutrient uptake outer membrane protein [Bacteroidota bacterium]